MPGGGSIIGMINSLKANRNLLKERRNPFNKDKFKNKLSPHRDLIFKHVSVSNLKEIKTKIRYQAQRERQFYVVVFISLLIIFTGALFYFYNRFIV